MLITTIFNPILPTKRESPYAATLPIRSIKRNLPEDSNPSVNHNLYLKGTLIGANVNAPSLVWLLCKFKGQNAKIKIRVAIAPTGSLRLMVAFLKSKHASAYHYFDFLLLIFDLSSPLT